MLIKLLAIFLLITSFYLSRLAISTASILWLLIGLFSLITSIGFFFDKYWSKYFWYITASLISLSWIISLLIVMSDWPYNSLLSNVISLIPGALLLVVCVGGNVVVAKHFLNIKL